MKPQRSALRPTRDSSRPLGGERLQVGNNFPFSDQWMAAIGQLSRTLRIKFYTIGQEECSDLHKYGDVADVSISQTSFQRDTLRSDL